MVGSFVPVFVLGTGRCGSTLVHEVLARHSGTGFVTNLDDLGLLRSRRSHHQLWRQLPGSVTEKGRARFAPSEGYRALQREVSPTIVDPARDLTSDDATPWLRSRMRGFVESRAHLAGAPVFLHKFTGWPRSGFLDECFPDALFVEVVRDGRAVANSWLQMPWWRGHRGEMQWHFGPLPPDLHEVWMSRGRSFPVLAALGWRTLMEAYERARASIGPSRWLTVRYEDLVAAPTERLAEMVTFVGCDWTPRFSAAVSRYQFTASRAEAFRRDLRASDVEAMESAIGSLLGRYGYV